MAEKFNTNDPGPLIRRKLNEAWAAWELALTTIKGDRGWSPLIRTIADGSRIVLQLYAWAGGQGSAPTVTGYMGASGIVTSIGQAMDIRGPQGAQGDLTQIGRAPNEVPVQGFLGALASLDELGVTQVLRHTLLSKPGDVWRERVSDTQTIIKYHGDDGIVRSRLEAWT